MYGSAGWARASSAEEETMAEQNAPEAGRHLHVTVLLVASRRALDNALAELSARGESWELQSRIDTEAGRAIYQSLSRHRPVEAIDAAEDAEIEPESAEAPALDVESEEGLQALKR